MSELSYLWTVFVDEDSRLSDYSPLMHVTFAANIAYAILLKVGQLQGTHLVRFARDQDRRAVLAHKALSSEGKNQPGIKPDGDREKALGIVSDARKMFKRATPKFAASCLFSAVINLLLIYACGAWSESKISNLFMFGLEMLLLLPIPCGLAWTHWRCRGFEQKITKEYDNFFSACDHLTDKPAEAIQQQVNDLRKALNLSRPGLLSRLLFGND